MLPDRGRRTLQLRAGLLGGKPASRRTIARQIGISPTGVLALERSSLRRLVSAGQDGGCDGGAGAAVAGGASGSSGEWNAPSSGEGVGSDSESSDAKGESGAPETGEVLADFHEGGSGLVLDDGKETTTETLLFFLLTLLALLGPLAAIAFVMQRRAAANGAAVQADERPLLFLDVDGVIALDLFSKGLPPGEMRDSPLGLIYLPHRSGELVRELAKRFDVVWATGWEHHANTGLAKPLGLPEELPVLTFGKKARAGSSDWKLKRVNSYAGGRPAAWLDDNFASRHERWAAHRSEPTLLVRVDPHTGLAPDHVERLLRWADRLEAAQAAKANGQHQTRAS
ncbi:MAG TPA: HAD domain-containing protein [Thermoleophilaceae bacterium]|nr:HAD domain-containing protein [Thermoleophilaceae bacterium]